MAFIKYAVLLFIAFYAVLAILFYVIPFLLVSFNKKQGEVRNYNEMVFYQKDNELKFPDFAIVCLGAENRATVSGIDADYNVFRVTSTSRENFEVSSKRDVTFPQNNSDMEFAISGKKFSTYIPYQKDYQHGGRIIIYAGFTGAYLKWVANWKNIFFFYLWVFNH